jgi:hypothetical protein
MCCHSCLKVISQSYLIRLRRVKIIDLILILLYFYFYKVAIRLSTWRIFLTLLLEIFLRGWFNHCELNQFVNVMSGAAMYYYNLREMIICWKCKRFIDYFMIHKCRKIVKDEVHENANAWLLYSLSNLIVHQFNCHEWLH